jgi:hypothetical protein
VFVREFTLSAFPSPPDNGSVPRLIERRFHVVGAPRGYGASYRLGAAGDGELIEDGATLDGTDSTPTWWFPALDDALGEVIVNPSYRRITAAVELNQPAGEDGPTILADLRGRGWLNTDPRPDLLDRIPAGAIWSATQAPVEARVRHYLHANCAVCHQPGGASRGRFDARITTPLPEAGLINAEPAAGDLWIAGAQVVKPGDPEKSILYQRLKRTDFFRMPPVAYHDTPSPILPVVAEWIRGLAGTEQP